MHTTNTHTLQRQDRLTSWQTGDITFANVWAYARDILRVIARVFQLALLFSPSMILAPIMLLSAQVLPAHQADLVALTM